MLLSENCHSMTMEGWNSGILFPQGKITFDNEKNAPSQWNGQKLNQAATKKYWFLYIYNSVYIKASFTLYYMVVLCQRTMIMLQMSEFRDFVKIQNKDE